MNFLKKNYIVIIVSLIVSLISIYEISLIKKEHYEEYTGNEKVYRAYCIEQNKFSEEICANLKQDINNNQKLEFYNTLTEFDVRCGVILDFIVFLMLAFVIVFKLHTYLKNQVICTYLIKEKYSSVLKKMLKAAYKYILLFQTLLVGLILYLYLTTNVGTFSYLFNNFNYSPILFFSLYLLNAILLSGFYINVILMVLRYKNNYFIAVTLSFLIYLSLYLIFDLTIGTIFINNILLVPSIGELFSVVGIYLFNINEVITPLIRVLFSLSLYIISFLIVYLVYRNKEKLVIDIEKNSKEVV